MIQTFQAKIEGTRKMREWVAYKETVDGRIVIQSDDAIAYIKPDDSGWSVVRPGGAYFFHLQFAKECRFPAGTFQAAKVAAPKSGDCLSETIGVYQS